jgi:hypothetical protein
MKSIKKAHIVFGQSRIPWNRRTFAPSIPWNIGGTPVKSHTDGFPENPTYRRRSSENGYLMRTLKKSIMPVEISASLI